MASQVYDLRTASGYTDPLHRNTVADVLLDLETMLFDPSVRRDTSTVAELLADDFREFGSSGRVYTKMDILAELSTEPPSTITLTDFNCDLLAPNVALVTYRSLVKHDSRPGSQALRSSVWLLKQPEMRYGQSPREGRWQMQFHQGTRF